MIKRNLRHKNLFLLLTCVLAACVLFMGMQVPDLSRPHRPKPSHRACIEKQFKPCQQAIKKVLESVALPAAPVEIRPIASYRAPLPLPFQSGAFHPLFPNLSRAPPLC